MAEDLVLRSEDALTLPNVIPSNLALIDSLVEALGIPRDALAPRDEIEGAWASLPRELRAIPLEKRDAPLARMCVAVSTGLFDAAINQAWNIAIRELRAKVTDFGFAAVTHLTNKTFDAERIRELKDVELIQLCFELNLIDEEAHFFLNQSRDVRNHFSSAHPPVGQVDDREFIAFLHRCIKYAVKETENPRGIDPSALLTRIRAGSFSPDQSEHWVRALLGTHDAQRQLLLGTLHGLYCDPTVGEDVRQNAMQLVLGIAGSISEEAICRAVTVHAEYRAKGDEPRVRASRDFFAKVGLIQHLDAVEQHVIIEAAAQRLVEVHHGRDNFYNEPPFAEHLYALVSQTAVPQSLRAKYVAIVVRCATGNPWGASTAALPTYQKLYERMSPAEIVVALELHGGDGMFSRELKTHTQMLRRYLHRLRWLDPKSVPQRYQSLYDSLMAYSPTVDPE